MVKNGTQSTMHLRIVRLISASRRCFPCLLTRSPHRPRARASLQINIFYISHYFLAIICNFFLNNSFLVSLSRPSAPRMLFYTVAICATTRFIHSSIARI